MRKLLLLSLLALPLFAQPRIVHGTMTSVRAAGDLGAQIVALGDGWNGYSVPTDRRYITTCSGDGDSITINDGDDDLRVVGDGTLSIFFRVAEGRIERIRLHTADCSLDANGAAVHWIEGVSPASSERFLRSLVDSSSVRERVAKHALTALALQAGTTDTLIDLARHHASSHMRGQALFWLSQRAGEKAAAAAALKDAVNNDPEEQIREKAVFAISQLPDDRSVPLLIELMKTHRSPGVRRKAAFWLGQKNDPRALEALADILR